MLSWHTGPLNRQHEYIIHVFDHQGFGYGLEYCSGFGFGLEYCPGFGFNSGVGVELLCGVGVLV